MQCQKIFLAVLLQGCCILNNPCIAQTTFQKSFGANFGNVGFSVQQAPDGGYIVAGNTFTSSPDAYNFYLVKTDSVGNMVWNKTFGVTGDDYATCIQNASDGGYIAVGFLNSWGITCIVKTDTGGNLTWSKTYPAPDRSSANYIQPTADGGYVVTGTYQDSSITDNSNFHIFKTDNIGNLIWSRIYVLNNPNWIEGRSVRQTPDGSYIAVAYGNGLSLVKADSSGNLLWAKSYAPVNTFVSGSAVEIASDGNYIVAGQVISPDRAYLLKTDTAGNPLWSKIYNDVLQSRLDFVQSTADGGYILTGERNTSTGNNYDALLIKTDSAGNEQWRRIYGNNYESGKYVRQTNDGGYIMTGYTALNVSSPFKVYLVKTDSNGASACYDNSIVLTDTAVITLDINLSLTDTALGVANAFTPSTGMQGVSDSPCLSVGEEEIMMPVEQNRVTVYPNPATDELYIISYTLLEKASITIYNALGERVYKSEIRNTKLEIDVSGFLSGVYSVTLTNNNKSRVTKKFVKM